MRSRLLAVLLYALCAVPALADGLFADRVLVKGRILTVDADDSIAECGRAHG